MHVNPLFRCAPYICRRHHLLMDRHPHFLPLPLDIGTNQTLHPSTNPRPGIDIIFLFSLSCLDSFSVLFSARHLPRTEFIEQHQENPTRRWWNPALSTALTRFSTSVKSTLACKISCEIKATRKRTDLIIKAFNIHSIYIVSGDIVTYIVGNGVDLDCCLLNVIMTVFFWITCDY